MLSLNRRVKDNVFLSLSVCDRIWIQMSCIDRRRLMCVCVCVCVCVYVCVFVCMNSGRLVKDDAVFMFMLRERERKRSCEGDGANT